MEQKNAIIEKIVKVKGEYISQGCIEECVKNFNEINDEIEKVPDSSPNPKLKPKLMIIADKIIKEVDILLIAYFILFKKQIPNLEIMLILNNNTINEGDENDLIQKVRQYMVYAYLACGKNIFEVKHSTGTIKIVLPFPENWFVLSRKFMPVVFINDDTLKNTFQESFSYFSIKNNVTYNINDDIFYKSCKQYLFSLINKNENYIYILSQLAFYRALDKAKILTLYLYSELNNNQITPDLVLKEKIKAGYLRGTAAYDYYLEIKNIFDELRSRPPIFCFIYSTLLLTDLLPGSLASNNINLFKNTLSNLWSFTKELVYGLHELAKNIVEHSSNKVGVITGRMYKNGLHPCG